MSDQMGSFRVDVEIENPANPGDRRVIRSVLVDTGAELSWLVLLGARSLEGLNLRIEPRGHRLVDAGPAPAAAILQHPTPPPKQRRLNGHASRSVR